MAHLDDTGAFAEAVLAELRRSDEAAAWVSGSEQAFVAFVRERADDAAAEVLLPRVADFALLFGCLEGRDDVLRAFDERILDNLGRAFASEADVKQDLLARLFLPSGSRAPRALRYGGTGPLAGWVRRTATNLLRSSRRKSDPPAADGERAAAEPSQEAGPEEDYRSKVETFAFRTALREATSALGARDRELLRLHAVERLTVQQLADRFDVHRETAGRWLDAARAALAEATRAHLEQALGLSREATRGVIAEAIEAGIGSIGRLLASLPGAGAEGDHDPERLRKSEKHRLVSPRHPTSPDLEASIDRTRSERPEAVTREDEPVATIAASNERPLR